MATSYIQTNNRGSVSVTADGVKTYAQLLNQLLQSVDFEKIRPQSLLALNGAIAQMLRIDVSELRFTISTLVESNLATYFIRLGSNSTYEAFYENGFHNLSSGIPTYGSMITIYY